MTATAALPIVSTPELVLSGLSIEFPTEAGWVTVVDGVDLTLTAGETLGLVGESGSGKTVTSMAMMGMIPLLGGRVTAGSLSLEGRDLFRLGERELRHVRGREVAMVFQQPRRSLDPNFTIGDQIIESVVANGGGSRRQARDQAIELLDRVGIAEPHRRMKEYPHNFSGGMCQRVMIAIALAGRPKFVIADEPTTALDVTVQAQVLDLLKDLQDEMGLGILFVTHDLSVIAQMSDRVAVMYAGQVVEQGPTARVLHDPTHPYTAALVQSHPDVAAAAATPSFVAIPGRVPVPGEWPSGCRFHPRCDHATDACAAGMPSLDQVESSWSRCVRRQQGEIELRGAPW